MIFWFKKEEDINEKAEGMSMFLPSPVVTSEIKKLEPPPPPMSL